ncbi:MAG: hypothetical protein K1X75_09335 [Leptospirales bacterium]|nr:hypothetical protein [Leptospirales bacterium]
MRSLRRVYLSLTIGLSVAGYALAFGDAGLLVQRDLHQDLAAVEGQIDSLKRENAALNERLASFQERTPDESRNAAQPSRAVILKFESAASQNRQAQNQGLSLTEARALYLTGMFCLIIFGYYLLRRLDSGRDNPGVI